MFQEEIHVIACERWLNSVKYTGNIRQSYDMAIKKTVISLTKNWAADFIIQNLKHFLKPNYTIFNQILSQTKTYRMQDTKIQDNIREW